jgi:hypothetical protein
MTQYVKEQYEKPGATFADGAAAWADKNSLYSPELEASAEDSNNNALAAGILTEPIHAEWVQSTFTVEICKHVTSLDAYLEARTYDPVAIKAAAAEAGWTYLGRTVQDQE